VTPTATRRLLHAVHGVTTLALLVTGCLIEWPDLRARFVGGYGRELARIHLWFGWAFAAAPLLAAGAAGALFEDLQRRLGPPDPITWRKLHIVITGVASLLLTASGIILWGFPELPLLVQDISLEIHSWTTWIVAALLPVHLVVARRKIAERVGWFRADESQLFEFGEEDSEPEDL
jgi:cytochrome b subunit of formate dehydrogenase